MDSQDLINTFSLTMKNAHERLAEQASNSEIDFVAKTLAFHSSLVRMAYEDSIGEQFSSDNLETLRSLYFE